MKVPITQAQAWAVIAESLGLNAKELPVLPEPVGHTDAYWLSNKGGGQFSKGTQCGDVRLFTADQLQAYGAACAAHAREMALSEAAQVATSTVCDTHIPTGVKIYGTRAGKAIEALKGK